MSTKRKFKDFDAFWSEKEREPISFRAFGEVCELPSALPMAVLLKIVRLQREHGNAAEIPHTDLLDIGDDLFGAELMERFLAKQIDMDQFGDLISWVIEQYNGGADEASQGNGQERPVSTSSKTGRSSKRTS